MSWTMGEFRQATASVPDDAVIHIQVRGMDIKRMDSVSYMDRPTLGIPALVVSHLSNNQINKFASTDTLVSHVNKYEGGL